MTDDLDRALSDAVKPLRAVHSLRLLLLTRKLVTSVVHARLCTARLGEGQEERGGEDRAVQPCLAAGRRHGPGKVSTARCGQ